MIELPPNRKAVVARSRDAAALDLAQITIGDMFSVEHRFESEDLDRFAALSGDYSPLHVDDDFATETEFGGRVVHGILLASLFSTLVGMKIPGRRALYIGQELNFRRPVLVGEIVTATAKVVSVNSTLGVIQLAMTLRKSDGAVAINGAGRVRVRDSVIVAKKEANSKPASDRKLRLPVALITGASRGIGAAIARRLAKDGFAVALNYLSSEGPAQRLADEIRAGGGTAVTMQADIMDKNALASVAEEIVSAFGQLDLLVNNASPGYLNKNIDELVWDDIQVQIDASVRAPFMLARNLFPLLSKSGGAVVNVISQVVEGVPPSNMLDYVLGKYGLLGLTRGMAAEWASAGVRVNGVAPSLIETDLTGHLKDRVFKLEASRTPLKRIATADDVAAAVAYLGGRDASFVTGLVVPVTGGQVMV